jgi:NAD(P)-dependent dehydrogenase (short-subunit alcohol dehydrogenase family)
MRNRVMTRLVRASVAAFVGQVGERVTGVDVLINCVGFFPVAPFEEMTFDQ